MSEVMFIAYFALIGLLVASAMVGIVFATCSAARQSLQCFKAGDRHGAYMFAGIAFALGTCSALFIMTPFVVLATSK